MGAGPVQYHAPVWCCQAARRSEVASSESLAGLKRTRKDMVWKLKGWEADYPALANTIEQKLQKLEVKIEEIETNRRLKNTYYRVFSDEPELVPPGHGWKPCGQASAPAPILRVVS